MKLSMLATCLAIAAGSAIAEPRVSDPVTASQWAIANVGPRLARNGWTYEIQASSLIVCQNGELWVHYRVPGWSFQQHHFGRITLGPPVIDEDLYQREVYVEWFYSLPSGC